MGFTDYVSDLFFSTAHADAPEEDDDKKEDKEEGGDEGDNNEDKEGGDEESEEKNDGGDEPEEEEEEEEEDEPVDPKPKLEEDCARSHQCIGYKHHYDECVERVTAEAENPEQHKGHKEDCVEEFFHLQHCATQCAAPKLFKQLK